MQVPRKQHVVSKSLLRRFCDDTGKLTVQDLRSGRCLLRAPSAMGWFRDFVSHEQIRMEAQWKRVEDRLPAALDHAEAGVIFQHPQSAAIVKEAIVMHFVRSLLIKGFEELVMPMALESVRSEMVRNHPDALARRFEERHGFKAAGIEALRLEAQTLCPPEDFASGAPFVDRLRDLHVNAESFLSTWDLQIGVAQGEIDVLIGDTPALPINHDRRCAGIFNDVALGDAHAVVLPLGRRHLACLGRNSRYVEMADTIVERYNGYQINCAQTRVGYHPDSKLSTSVVTMRPPLVRARSRG